MADDAIKRVPRTFHYKVAQFGSDGKASLQSRLKKAFADKPKAMARREEISYGGEKTYRWINHLKDVGLLSCGMLVSYKEGMLPSTVTLDENAEELILEAIEQAQEEGDEQKRREYLEGLLFFGVYQNSIILTGSAHLLSSHLESHLTWVLSKLTERMDEGEILLITDNVSPDFSQTKYSKLKEIRITSNIQIEEDKESQDVSNRQSKPAGAWWRGIVNLIGDAYSVEPPETNFKGGLHSSDLKVTLSVKLANARGRTGQNTPVIDPLANSFRHMDDPPIELFFTNGEELKGNQFKVRKPFSVRSRHGMPFEDDVYGKMDSWLRTLLGSDNLKRS